MALPDDQAPESDNPLDDAIALFHEEHEREYSFADKDKPVEFYQIGLTAIGEIESPPFARFEVQPHDAAAPERTRQVYFSSAGGWQDTPVYAREELTAGARLQDPAIIDQLDATTVVPPGDAAEIDEWGNIRIHIGKAAPDTTATGATAASGSA